MTLATAAYSYSPSWVQDLLVSAYGLKLTTIRYGATGRRTLSSLRHTEWMPSGDIEQFQLAAVSELIARAVRDVPFYRERPAYHRQVKSLDELSRLPSLTKSAVQHAGRTMISDQYSHRRLQQVHTGGTTGKPLAVFCDRETLQRNYAFFTRFKESAGITARARVATFAGRALVPSDRGAPYWRRNFAANTLLFSSYHIRKETIPLYVEALGKFGPELIDSYPSSLEPIARYLLANHIRSVRPWAIITSSETLFPSVRDLLTRAFGCPVFDHYGAAEMVALITQCQHGTYHANKEFGVVEIVNGDSAARPGERGEIVATGFINPVMPLVRYATGDFAVVGDGRCACGRSGQTFERIEGRVDDVLITPEGNLVGRLDPVFKAVDSLYETRIVQDALDHVTVEAVASEGFTAEMEAELRHQLQLRLGRLMRIDIVRVAGIPRTARGKLRTVVNLVSPGQRIGAAAH